jgi:hypothetical protein
MAKLFYARWWNSAATVIDKATGQESRPEHMVSVEYQLEDTEKWELSGFLDSKALKRLPGKFGPPHEPIDYFENVAVQITSTNGKSKMISTREFYVASLEEKTRYPSVLIVLMDKIDEIEREANEKESRPSPARLSVETATKLSAEPLPPRGNLAPNSIAIRKMARQHLYGGKVKL